MLKYQGSLSSFDLFLELEAFSEGRSTHAWRCFGAHPAEDEAGREGYLFRVWAPNAPKVTIIGDFNGWDLEATPMTKLEGGIWEAFVPGCAAMTPISMPYIKRTAPSWAKPIPMASTPATRPDVSTKIYDLWENAYQWGDQSWLEYRSKYVPYTGPMNIYEWSPGLLAAHRRGGVPQLSGYRLLSGTLCKGDGVHPCGAPAGHRAPPGCLLGLSMHRILCRYQPLRHP